MDQDRRGGHRARQLCPRVRQQLFATRPVRLGRRRERRLPDGYLGKAVARVGRRLEYLRTEAIRRNRGD
jgi:hypothetical protein